MIALAPILTAFGAHADTTVTNTNTAVVSNMVTVATNTCGNTANGGNGGKGGKGGSVNFSKNGNTGGNGGNGGSGGAGGAIITGAATSNVTIINQVNTNVTTISGCCNSCCLVRSCDK